MSALLPRSRCGSRQHTPRGESNRLSERLRPPSSRRYRNRKTNVSRRPLPTYGRVRCRNTWEAHQNAPTVRTTARIRSQRHGFYEEGLRASHIAAVHWLLTTARTFLRPIRSTHKQ